MPKIDICIVTYRRKNGLNRLLQAINDLNFKNNKPDLNVVIVDNDINGSANEVVNRYQDNAPWNISYFLEPRRGIDIARNTSLLHIREDVEYIAFVDDDEVPTPQWLDQMLLTQRAFGADVVIGPVIPHFIEPPPDWVLKSGYFEELHYCDGQELGFGYTSNALVSVEIIREMCSDQGSCFDEYLALQGGGDTVFFGTVIDHGAKAVWSEKAIVYEWIPPSKANAIWILKRAFRTAQTDTYLDMQRKPIFIARLRRLVLGSGRIFTGILMFLPWSIGGLIYGKHVVIKPIRIISRGLGMILGVFGILWNEYSQIHEV